MTTNVRRRGKRLRLRRPGLRLAARIATYVALTLVSYQFLYPLLRMLSLGLMSPTDVINPTVNWLPKDWSFGNLITAMRVLKLPRTLINSILFSGGLAAAQTLVSSLTGYAFARFEFWGKRFWFVMVLLSFILPMPVLIIPRSMMFDALQGLTGWQIIGTPWPQMVMGLLGQGVYSAILILIFYNFTRMIPRSLDEAASIDGAGSFQVFYHVILRLSLSTLLVVFMFSMVWNWNESFQTSTFLRDKIPLLPMQLHAFDSLFESLYGSASAAQSGLGSKLNEAYRMAATLLTILPLLVMYLFVQKQFIAGIENAGITGE